MAVPTTCCFYVGALNDFAADAASASSNLGNFYPGNSGLASLNAALAAGYIPASQVPTAFRQNVPNATKNQSSTQGSVAQSGYMWTLYTQAGVP